MTHAKRVVILGRVFEQMPGFLHEACRHPIEVVSVNDASIVDRERLHLTVRDAAGIVSLPTVSIDAAMMDAAGEALRVISNHAVGLDNVDLAAAAARGVVVTNTPEPVCEPTADIAWLLILAAARRAREGERLLRDGHWNGFAADLLLGQRLVGKTLLVVGAGRIGAAVARRSLGWDMRVLYVARSDKPQLESPPLQAKRVSLDEGLAQADIVSLHVPLNSDTHHLISRDRLKMMKPTAVLINTARGCVIDEDALVEALTSRTIFAAGLDVFEHEPQVRQALLDLPNVLTLPHLGSATEEDRLWLTHLVADNLAAVLNSQDAGSR